METNNVEMAPEVVECNALGSKPNFWGAFVISGAAIAWTGFVGIPVISFIKEQFKNRKRAKLQIVEDEEE